MSEFDRLWAGEVDRIAKNVRLRVFQHTVEQRGGYLSQACSAGQILGALYHGLMNLPAVDKPLMPDPWSGVPGPGHPARTGIKFNSNGQPGCDRFVLSPAQYALVLYAVLIETGRMDEAGMASYNQDGSSVEMIGAEHSPGMEVTTGSLGQGISQASGIAMALRLKGETGRVFVFLSDGECQSGEFWEALQAASFHRQDNLILVVDRNGCQCDGVMDPVMNIEPFDDRFRAFGCECVRISGHDPLALAAALDTPHEGKPLAVVCDTDPCYQMEFLRERHPKFHYIRFTQPGQWEDYRDRYEAMAKEAGQ